MVLITILSSDNDVSTKDVVKMKTAIERNTGIQVYEIHVVPQEDLVKMVANKMEDLKSKTFIDNVSKNSTVISLSEVDSAIQFLSNTFGDPLDCENAVRVRINKVLYNPAVSTKKDRLKACIDMFSKLYIYSKTTRLPNEYSELLEDTGFTFMLEWSNSILRFDKM